MKKLQPCLLLFVLLFACKKKEENLPCNGNGFLQTSIYQYDSAQVTQTMQQSTTSNRVYYWNQPVADVCPSIGVKGGYTVQVRKDMDTAITIRYSRWAVSPRGGSQSKSSTPVKTLQTIGGMEYYVYTADFDEIICETCGNSAYNYELRIEAEISSTAGDPAAYIGNSIPKVVIKSEYFPY